VERLIPEVVDVIEDSNAGQVEVALPVYGAVALAHSDDIKVMITGQGADELFGGYSWYSKVAEREGYRKLRGRMVEDLLLLYKETLEREDKITMAHSIELREPFLDPEVVRVALATDLHLNVLGGDDAFGKHVHRKVAQYLGIPEDIAYRVKEAAQHGSGIHATIDSIARRRGYDEDSVPTSYVQLLKNREKVGSSQRYGYLFDEDDIWLCEPHVQLYLDTVSSKAPRSQVLAEARNSRKPAAGN
jgi:asparagine synthase (glutamine-hydrolysing)